MPGIWTDDDERKYPERMGRLAIMFNRDLTVDLLTLYRDELGDLDADQVLKGLTACVRESRFWPSIAEIRERAGAYNVADMQQRIETRASAAGGDRIEGGGGAGGDYPWRLSTS